MSPKHHTKYIFVTGGVVSSLGKGIVAASLGALLESRGLKVSLSKADPYLNVDPGTMSPVQHGEVFVTEDGAETDLDLGHYERFTKANLLRRNSFSAGQVYDTVLGYERSGRYLGRTVQMVPHITQEIKERMFRAAEGSDIAIIEIGGTVGDIEGLPFLEAIRQIRYEMGDRNVLCVHLTLVPYIAAAKELKTKPTQHSVKELRALGIEPDIPICRADREVPQELRHKIATFCSVAPEHVIEACDIDHIDRIPLVLHRQGLDRIIVQRLEIWARQPDLAQWLWIEHQLAHPTGRLKVAIVGKYISVVDSYKSIAEALGHAGIFHALSVRITYIDAETLDRDEDLEGFDAIIVPGGFGERASQGKLRAITFARTRNVPFLGICLGMQLSVIEYAQNVIGLKNAGSEEFPGEGETHPLIHLMEDQKSKSQKGGSMRLGGYPCRLKEGTLAFAIYGQGEIIERHRHRYEFNNAYRTQCEDHGLVFSGLSPDGSLVEIVELSTHPFFIGCQFHPELKSKPMSVHPLFRDLVAKAWELKSHSQ